MFGQPLSGIPHGENTRGPMGGRVEVIEHRALWGLLAKK